MAINGELFEGQESVGRAADTVSGMPERKQGSRKREAGEPIAQAYPWEYFATQHDVGPTIQQPEGYSCLITSAPLWDNVHGKSVIVCLWGRPVR